MTQRRTAGLPRPCAALTLPRASCGLPRLAQTCARATHFEPLLHGVAARPVVTPPAEIVIAQPYTVDTHRSRLRRRVSRRFFCPPAPGRLPLINRHATPYTLRQKHPDLKPHAI